MSENFWNEIPEAQNYIDGNKEAELKKNELAELRAELEAARADTKKQAEKHAETLCEYQRLRAELEAAQTQIEDLKIIAALSGEPAPQCKIITSTGLPELEAAQAELKSWHQIASWEDGSGDVHYHTPEEIKILLEKAREK